jgi:hypothetical protein
VKIQQTPVQFCRKQKKKKKKKKHQFRKRKKHDHKTFSLFSLSKKKFVVIDVPGARTVDGADANVRRSNAS